MGQPKLQDCFSSTISSVPSFPLPRLIQPGVKRDGYTEEPEHTICKMAAHGRQTLMDSGSSSASQMSLHCGGLWGKSTEPWPLMHTAIHHHSYCKHHELQQPACLPAGSSLHINDSEISFKGETVKEAPGTAVRTTGGYYSPPPPFSYQCCGRGIHSSEDAAARGWWHQVAAAPRDVLAFLFLQHWQRTGLAKALPWLC